MTFDCLVWCETKLLALHEFTCFVFNYCFELVGFISKNFPFLSLVFISVSYYFAVPVG